jgi:hypothetical protein
MITEDEHKAIQDYAGGASYHTPERPRMEAIYQREVRGTTIPLVMQFLSEVFSPVPDLYRRGQLRRRVRQGER